jgi:signal transduction histidine kinase
MKTTSARWFVARALNNLCDTLSQTIYQLRAEKSQLNQILSSFSEGIAATDSVGVLTHFNPALMRMFGSVRVNTRCELIPDSGIWDAFDEVYRTGEPQSMRYPLPGDRMLWITISPVVTEAGERTGVVGLFKDMTEMELLERTRREYVANVSHELRTPLTPFGLAGAACRRHGAERGGQAEILPHYATRGNGFRASSRI